MARIRSSGLKPYRPAWKNASAKRLRGVFDHIFGAPVEPPVKNFKHGASGPMTGRRSFRAAEGITGMAPAGRSLGRSVRTTGDIQALTHLGHGPP